MKVTLGRRGRQGPWRAGGGWGRRSSRSLSLRKKRHPLGSTVHTVQECLRCIPGQWFTFFRPGLPKKSPPGMPLLPKRQ